MMMMMTMITSAVDQFFRVNGSAGDILKGAQTFIFVVESITEL